LIPFSPPHIDDLIIEEVSKCLRSGWITTGPRTKLFEKKISEYCGNEATVCVGSATAGLELMLRWYGVGHGDEVILPAYTYCATANVIMHCGAKPVFVDINKHDFNISFENIKDAINYKTKVIMPVDFAGNCCDYDEILDYISKLTTKRKFMPRTEEQAALERILVLADAAHSFGAVYKGRKTGTLADASVFSFHAVKNLTTAEGGAIALNFPEPFENEEIYRQLCISSLHGQNKDALAKLQKGSWKYDVTEAGYKCNMTDIQAAIGLVELSRYDAILKKRKYICERYAAGLSEYDWAELPVLQDKDKDSSSSYHLFPLRIKKVNESKRDAIIQGIFDEDVAVNVHFLPVPMLSFYKTQGYRIMDFPIAYNQYSREISLPVYFDLTDEQIETVIKAVIKVVENSDSY